MDNGVTPFISRVIAEETSQVADICIVQGNSEGYWAFWEGMNNIKAGLGTAGASNIICAPCIEPIYRWDGNQWTQVSGVPSYSPPEFAKIGGIRGATGTATNREEVLVDTSGGGITYNLPYADPGSYVRIVNVGTANLVTVAVQSGDAITSGASPTIAAGLSLTFRCYVANKWVKSNS